MIVAIIPYLIFLGVIVLVAMVLFGTGFNFQGFFGKYATRFTADLAKADMKTEPVSYLIGSVGAGLILWLGVVLLLYSNTLIVLVAFPLCLAISFFGGSVFLKFRGGRRLGAFTDQLEQVMRMISGAMRVGLSLRQALQMVTEELPDPARREFLRVVGRTNLGVPIVDALDEVAKGMPGSEMDMFARVVRVQQSTGGDLAKVLDKLAATIRDRRQIKRKMSALTAQGRFGAGIIGLLPVGVGGFIIGTQPEMNAALLHTIPGYFVLGIAVGLETAALFTLSKILKLDV